MLLHVHVCGVAHLLLSPSIMHIYALIKAQSCMRVHSCTLIICYTPSHSLVYIFDYNANPLINSYWFRELTTLYIWVIGLKHVLTLVWSSQFKMMKLQ